jgi:hypothetical protein
LVAMSDHFEKVLVEKHPRLAIVPATASLSPGTGGTHQMLLMWNWALPPLRGVNRHIFATCVASPRCVRWAWRADRNDNDRKFDYFDVC